MTSHRRERVSARAADPRRQLQALGPVEQLRAGRLGLRLPQLVLGLALYGISMALLIRGTLGVMPWDVLHQGLSRHVPLTFGQVVILTSLVVLLIWVPLRQSPGLGTVANAVLIGLVVDPVLSWVDPPEGWLPRIGLMTAGIVLNAMATAMYIGAQLGPGPRDGLMTGLARTTGGSIRVVRTLIEVGVVLAGFVLGGVLGVGTVLYALLIGPLTQAMLPWFVVPVRSSPRRPAPDLLRPPR